MRQTRDPEDIERREHAAYSQARARFPERTPSETTLGRSEGELPDGDRKDAELARDTDQNADEDAALNWAAAEKGRPDFADETEDGLDDTAEEVRREAEDRHAPEGDL